LISSIIANAFNFDKYNDTDVDTQMTSYDYGSVMHYERNAFAINSSGTTITPTQNTTAFIGQRVQLSPVDILEIQRYYGCVPTPTNPNATTSSTTSTITSTSATTTSATTSTSTQGNTATHNGFQSDLGMCFMGLISIIYFSNKAH
jgi:hypothetical protein